MNTDEGGRAHAVLIDLRSANNQPRKLMIPVGRGVMNKNGGHNNYAPTLIFDRVELRGSLIAQKNAKFHGAGG